MNKTLILVLAVCLVSVHAFVKRDAPETTAESFIQQGKKNAEEFFENIGKMLNPEAVKKNVDSFADGIKKALDDLKPKEEPKA